MLTFDPRKKDVGFSDGVQELNSKDVERKAIQLQRAIVEERRAAGEAQPESVPAIHRKTGDVRWFNLSPQYQGSLQLAEALLSGSWRLADKDEEKAALQLQAEAKQKALNAKASQLAMTRAAELAGAFAAQQMNHPLPAPVSTPPIPQGAETAKPKNSK